MIYKQRISESFEILYRIVNESKKKDNEFSQHNWTRAKLSLYF